MYFNKVNSMCQVHIYIILSIWISALKDYEEGLKLDPKNESLIADAERIRNIIQGTPIKWINHSVLLISLIVKIT